MVALSTIKARRIAYSSVLAALVAFLSVVIFLSERSDYEQKITFYGGVRGIGGSCLMVQKGEEKFIVDFGSDYEGGARNVPFDARDISFAVITHAHSDHCGGLSELFQSGFDGPVYCTEPSAELIPIMLRMTRSFHRKEIKKESLEKAINSLIPVPFDKSVEIGEVSFKFHRAEHLLGAAFVEFSLYSQKDTTILVVSGDLGSGNSILIPPLEEPPRADYVVVESTYGDLVRGDSLLNPIERQKGFAETVAKALKRGGDVLIPSFAQGRTQEVLAAIDYYERMDVIPLCDVYVDSPTARKINRIYRRYRDELSSMARWMYPDEPLRFPGLKEVRSKVSLKVHGREHKPSIFVSTSGNLNYAISPRHLIRMFDDPRNLVLLVGYQEPGSVGYRLARGDSVVRVTYTSGRKSRTVWIRPAIEVEQVGSFSGHADRRTIINWLKSTGSPKKVFIVHGEEEKAEALGRAIEEELKLEYEIPSKGESFDLAS